MSVQRVDLATALQDLREGDRLYMPGASGEPAGLVEALEGAWPAGRSAAITTTFIPGVNKLDFSKLDPAIGVTGLFMQPSFCEAERAGRYRHVPMSYAAFGRWLEECAEFDAVFVQVAPPDRGGCYSLGPSVEFAMTAIRKARKVIAVVNPNTPALVHTATLSEDVISHICEVGAPLRTYTIARDEISNAVAARVAPLIEDGAVIQIGIGKIPNALLSLLRDRRKLRFWSGLISDGVMALVEAGAVAPGEIGHACMALGSAEFYKWLNGRNDIVLHGCEISHGPRQLASLRGFVAINGALEVDLFGQCNLERVDGRALSGAGGAPDFAYAARRVPGGKSIVALPSEASGRSRIVAALGRASMTSLSRTEVDYVVTEHGVADLTHASVAERAERLIEVAAPAHRGELRDAWREIA